MSMQDPIVLGNIEEGRITFQVIARGVLGKPDLPVLVIVSSSTRRTEPAAILDELAPVLWQMLAAKPGLPGALIPSLRVETGPPAPPSETPDETRSSRLRMVLRVMTERADRLREARGNSQAPSPDAHERQILKMITLLEIVIQKEAHRAGAAHSREAAPGKVGCDSVPIRLPFHGLPRAQAPGDPASPAGTARSR